jgi:hypothetical protein
MTQTKSSPCTTGQQNCPPATACSAERTIPEGLKVVQDYPGGNSVYASADGSHLYGPVISYSEAFEWAEQHPEASKGPASALVPSETLAALLERYERLAFECNEDGGGGWTCNGGAGVLSVMLEQAGIPHEFCVGLYHWPEEKLAEKWQLMEGGEPTAEELANYWDDEHHHFVEAEGLVIDPNGECRSEPRWQPAETAYDERYEMFTLDTWKGWDKCLSWSPYYGEDENGERRFYEPRECADSDHALARAIAILDAEQPAG